MTTERKVLIASQDAPIVQTTVYPAPSASIIDKMTATNNSAAIRTISVNLVPFGSTAGSTNRISATVSIAVGATYTFPEIVGHDLATGDFISVIADAAGVTIRASGRQTTTG